VDNHERDHRDWPDAEDASPSSADPTQPDATEPTVGPDQSASQPAWSQPPMSDPMDGAPEPFEAARPTERAETMETAEIESWPSQDASAGSTADTPESPAWPTDPPSAGSAEPDTWPTTPPERGEEPILEPAWTPQPAPEAAEPPPSEVEAYAAQPTMPADSNVDVSGPAAGPTAAAAHVVPAGEGAIGESTQCPRCGTENRPGLAFCHNCGQRLVATGVSSTVERPGTPEGTMACPRCGTHNRAGVAFCQNCGANLRGTAPGYVPPSVAAESGAETVEAPRRSAVLGPVVLLIGLVGIATGYLLPFLYGSSSLFDRAMGTDGYGVAFWSGYPDVGAGLADQAYFGLAGPIPILSLLLIVLAIAGFVQAAPGTVQRIGLGIALLWSVGLMVLFVVIELAGNWSGDLVGMLRVLSPAGIIFLLSSLIVLIGTLTRFGRS